MPRPRAAADAPGTRQRLLAAAAAEFASKGFAGASVDRIARAARVNKAMIYYHFKNKASLYRDILRDMFAAVDARVQATLASGMTPSEKLRAFVEAIALEAEARPHFPPIWFREIAEQGTHLDETTTRHIANVVTSLGGIIREGVEARQFAPVNPLIVHAGIVGPLLLYFASARMRRRLERGGVKGAAQFTRDDVVAHIQRVTVAMLEGRMS